MTVLADDATKANLVFWLVWGSPLWLFILVVLASWALEGGHSYTPPPPPPDPVNQLLDRKLAEANQQVKQLETEAAEQEVYYETQDRALDQAYEATRERIKKYLDQEHN